MQEFGAAIRLGDISAMVYSPSPADFQTAPFSGLAAIAGTHGHFVCHDEGRNKADAELTDQLAILLAWSVPSIRRRFGGFGDGADGTITSSRFIPLSMVRVWLSLS